MKAVASEEGRTHWVLAEMVRPYAVKGKKRRKTGENYDREEEGPYEDNANDEQQAEAEAEAERGGEEELDGIPIAPSEKNDGKKPGVIFVLEKASLEVAKVGKVIILIHAVLFKIIFFVFRFLVCYGFESLVKKYMPQGRILKNATSGQRLLKIVALRETLQSLFSSAFFHK